MSRHFERLPRRGWAAVPGTQFSRSVERSQRRFPFTSGSLLPPPPAPYSQCLPPLRSFPGPLFPIIWMRWTVSCCIGERGSPTLWIRHLPAHLTVVRGGGGVNATVIIFGRVSLWREMVCVKRRGKKTSHDCRDYVTILNCCFCEGGWGATIIIIYMILHALMNSRPKSIPLLEDAYMKLIWKNKISYRN